MRDADPPRSVQELVDELRPEVQCKYNVLVDQSILTCYHTSLYFSGSETGNNGAHPTLP